MRDRVSILIPIHNRSAMLGRTLASLQQITIPRDDLELVVVANACTDDTVEMVQQLAAHLGFPVSCLQEPRANATLDRNVGVKASSGTIIAVLDDDVWVGPGWDMGLMEACESHPADLVAGEVDLWWDTTPKPGRFTRELDAMLSCKNHGQEVIELFRRGDAIGEFIPWLDRTGNALLGGAETEYVQRAPHASSARSSDVPHPHPGSQRRELPAARVAAAAQAATRGKSERDQHRGVGELDTRQRRGICRSGAARFAGKLPRFPADVHTWHVARRVLSGRHQCSTHLTSELWYRLRGDKGKSVHHRVRRSVGMGKMVGFFQRLIGRTEVERFNARVRSRS